AAAPDRALETLASLCARHPGREELFERGERLADVAGRPEALLPILERRQRALEGEPFVRSVLRAAALEAERLGRPGRAFERLCAALEREPHAAALYEAAERAARAADELPAYATVLGTLGDRALDAETARHLFGQRGRLLRELGQHDAAAALYTRLIPLCPTDPEPRALLRATLAAAGRHKDRVMAIERERRAPIGLAAAQRVALLRDAARPGAGALANRWEARDAWERLLAEAPGDPEGSAALAALRARPAHGDAPSAEELLELDELDELLEEPTPKEP